MVADISKTLGRDFLISSFVPASIVVGINVLYVRWSLLPREWFQDWTVFGSKSVVLVIAMFSVGLLLSLFRTFIYRCFEGYNRRLLLRGGAGLLALGLFAPFWISTQELRWVSEWLRWTGALCTAMGALQYATLRRHQKRHAAILASQPEGMSRYQFTRNYPDEPKQVLPTSFGNVLRAFEEYPFRLYSMDSVSFWPRLAAVLPDAFVTQITDAKTIVTLFLNVCVVGAWMAVETVAVMPDMQREKWFGAAAAWALLGCVGYGAATTAAKVWGEYVRSAFDLYRIDLLKRFALDVPSGLLTLEQEQELWQNVQVATYYGQEPSNLQVVLKEAPPPRPDTANDSPLSRLAKWLFPS